MKAFTYADILMVPSYNHWESRKIVDISMKCKMGKLTLDVPLMTSNMDTITEANMANFIGAKGGIGVLHRYISIEDNVGMFNKFKYPVFVSIGCAEKDLERAEALRELDVLDLLAQRLSTKEITEKLFVSTTTVNTHLRNIYGKLNVNKRREAVEKAMKIGIL